jgi:hypothetical protein
MDHCSSACMVSLIVTCELPLCFKGYVVGCCEAAKIFLSVINSVHTQGS